MHKDQQRIHYLDNLRAAMMLLGLVLHAALAYIASAPNRGWPFREEQTSHALSFLVLWIHSFRMEVFFFAAGFFFSLLFSRRGFVGTLENRTNRILLPLVLFWIVLAPLCISGFLYSAPGDKFLYIKEFLLNPFNMSLPVFAHLPVAMKESFGEFNLLHFWFLYYLLLFCGLGFVLDFPIRKLRLSQVFRPAVVPLLVSVFCALCLLLSKSVYFSAPTGLVPELSSFLAYGLFFLTGQIAFYSDRQSFAKKWVFNGVIGSLSFVLYFLFLKTLTKQFDWGFVWEAQTVFLLVTVFAGFSIGYLSFFFVGLFEHCANSKNVVWRYLLDSSYSLYLFQLPFTIWIPVLLVGWKVSLWYKFALTLFVTTLACLLIYNYLVRPSFLGKLLSGKKHPPVPFFQWLRGSSQGNLLAES